MPKASTSSARPALRRNQACLSCRKRKLKCDAARPHCATCVKQWQALISVPPPVGYAHPTEPQCSYDPVEGLPIAPDVDPVEKIRVLEEQISQLKSQLNEARSFVSQPASPTRRFLSNGRGLSSISTSSKHTPDASPTECGIVLPHVSLDPVNGSSSGSPVSQFRGSSGSPEMRYANGSRPGSASGLLYAAWDPDLPDPDTLNHYIDIFFRCDPCGSRVFHRPSFLASMHLHPRDPNFPHPAILHAICASASRWASNDVITEPNGMRRDKFAELHVNRTRHYVDKTMASGQDIFPIIQACMLLCWYFYQEGRWVEVWIFAGFQTRVAIPLRLNYPGTFASLGVNSPGAYLPPPKDFKDLELRRRTWWMTIMFDRIVSVGGWVHGMDERDIGTEFPVRGVDFAEEANVSSNPQYLSSKGAFTRHLPQYTDSFILFLKSVMLFGRVTDYNTRSSLRVSNLHTKSQDPFSLTGFGELDKLVCQDFLESFPQSYKHLGLSDGSGTLDSDLYMAHVVPHAATITLHNAYLNFSDPRNVSTSRCLSATRAILDAYYHLCGTSLDTTRLHPFVTICWYLAAVVQIQLCKHSIEIGDTAQESTVWGEINALRFAMLTYGARSPIGIRQEMLLQGLMTEIVRMTSQMHPLEVCVPLYPFSHAGVFSKEAVLQGHVGAPLPGSHPFEELSPPPGATMISSLMHGPSTLAGWTARYTTV
ncbi:hypothetical protein AcV5_004643 [Taiwanofungus camphoratus]|nr:hypothetical protein AcW2_000755 [Antrodia cinnamomea]KAI0936530.1 hypothetical protein AcV5_004643 [Antrodia cinnamomea]KAI0961744.1 hypothetical protein AcV7_000763 [Antrodia cinnamomea]